MSCHKQTLATLKDAGYRLTPQRAVILEAIHHLERHVTAEQILAYVERRYPHVDPSTVYRTLDLLTELNLVHTLDVSGQPTEYEIVEEDPHHHLVCRECGSVITVPAECFDLIHQHLQRTYDFKAEFNHLAVTGLCRSCQSDQAANS